MNFTFDFSTNTAQTLFILFFYFCAVLSLLSTLTGWIIKSPVENRQYTNFKLKFEEVVKRTIDKELLIPEVVIDMEIELEDITPKFFRILKQMAPFGPQNMNPIFKSSSLRDTGYGKQVGADKSHLKITVSSNTCIHKFNAIGFGLGDKISTVQNEFDMTYQLAENVWNGKTSIQLMIKDIL